MANSSPIHRPNTMRSSSRILAGAFLAAICCLIVTLLLPMIRVVLFTPENADWILVVIVFSIPVVAFYGVVGGIIGWLIHPGCNSILGAIIGFAVTLPIGLVFIAIFVSPAEPPGSFSTPILYSATIGSLTGIGCVIFQRSRSRGIQIHLIDLLVIALPISIMCTWCAYEIADNQLHAKIYSAGGNITWNGIHDTKGYWEISFRGSTITDDELDNVIPVLCKFSRIELDLGHTEVTERGIQGLSVLPNLARLRIDNTSLTSSEINAIRKLLPDTNIYDRWP